ncbi:hypothetical protein NPIL_324351 [Nephila pilipes]|uniref:Uncharacterized protein n=1 Tax=Nephila pilipes TaxID=299642 RepID=A0A8X6UV33_NEPPI|nr:hypothetical protein NPIL_324351 [Nephila pilipes]
MYFLCRGSSLAPLSCLIALMICIQQLSGCVVPPVCHLSPARDFNGATDRGNYLPWRTKADTEGVQTVGLWNDSTDCIIIIQEAGFFNKDFKRWNLRFSKAGKDLSAKFI